MKNERYAPHASSLWNVDANVMALLSYLSVIIFGWIPILRMVPWVAPLIIWKMEKNSRFVQFHALQSMILNIVSSIIAFIFGVIPAMVFASLFVVGFGRGLLIGTMFSILYLVFSLGIVTLAVISMIKAYRYEEFHIPVIGKIVEDRLNRTGRF